jgi:hypothetical protein
VRDNRYPVKLAGLSRASMSLRAIGGCTLVPRASRPRPIVMSRYSDVPSRPLAPGRADPPAVTIEALARPATALGLKGVGVPGWLPVRSNTKRPAHACNLTANEAAVVNHFLREQKQQLYDCLRFRVARSGMLAGVRTLDLNPNKAYESDNLSLFFERLGTQSIGHWYILFQ